MYFSGLKEKIRFTNYKYEMVGAIESRFIEEGFLYLESTPFEDYNKLVLEEGVEPEMLIKIIEPSGRIQVLSGDITSGLIEDIKNQWEEGTELKIFYNDKVFKSIDGEIKIFEKLGVESFGSFSPETDLDILLLANSILMTYSGEHIIEVGISSLVYNMIDRLNLDKLHKKALVSAIASKDGYAIKNIVSEHNGIEKEFFQNLLTFRGDIKKVKIALEKYGIPKEIMSSLESLEYNFNEIEKRGLGGAFYFDLSLIPDFNYYSAFSFRGYISNYNGTIIKGGRYLLNSKDEQVKIPGVGFSIEVGDLMKYLGGRLK